MIKYIAILIFGACVGSFINVIFYRLPKDESIIYPNSSCPDCNSRIKFYDLIPVLSWIFLRGKCRVCNSSKFINLFSLGKLSFTGKFAKSKKVNIPKDFLNLIICKKCKLVQLDRNFTNS